MKQLTKLAMILVLFGISSWAQEVRHEVTVQGSGFFNKQTTGNGISSDPTNSGGVMAGYRFNIRNWLAVEGDYDYFRNSQKFFSSGGATSVPTNVHTVTGVAVVKLPSFRAPGVKFVSPFVLAGAGVMSFNPREGSSSSDQTRGTFVYGGGLDVPLIKHVTFRTEYRGFVYKTPDFDTASLRVDQYTHSAVPSAGLVFHF